MTTAKKPTIYGWYSAKQAEIAGTFLYKTLDGGEMTVSQTTHGPVQTALFDDMKSLGKVGKFVRRTSRGSIDDYRTLGDGR